MNNVFVRLAIFAMFVFLFFYGLVLTKETTAANVIGWLLVVGAPISAFYFLKHIFANDKKVPALEAPVPAPEDNEESEVNGTQT